MARRPSGRVLFVTCLGMLTATLGAWAPQTGAGAQANARARSIGTATITGQVLDALSGAPIPGAVVRIIIQTVAPNAQAGTTGGTAVAATGTTGSPAGRGALAVGESVLTVVSGPNGGILTMDGSDAERPQLRILTDEGGQFALRNLPAGQVSFSVQATGYSGGGYGQLRPDGAPQPLDLGDGQHAGDIELKMWRNGAITGTVTDEVGDPAVGVFVRVLRRTMAAGQATLQLSGAGEATDDRGVYRAYGLTPGDYAVVVASTRSTTSTPAPGAVDPTVTIIGPAGAIRGGQPAAGQQVGNLLISDGLRGRGSGTPTAVVTAGDRVSVYPTTYYPSATVSSRAAIVTVKAGEEKSGVDIQLTLVPAFRVSGAVLDPDNRPAAGLAVTLLAVDADQAVDGLPDSVATTATDSIGGFVMLGVPSGQYLLSILRGGAGARGGAFMVVNGNVVSVTPPPGADSMAWARVPVSVNDADVSGLAVSLRPGLRLSGRVVFQGTSPQPTPAQLSRPFLRLMQVGHGTQAGRGGGSIPTLQPDGSFSGTDYAPGQYMFALGVSLPNWTLKSISVDGHDASDVPIDLTSGDVQNVILTFTDKPGQLAGTVRTPTGAPDPDALVVGFPADPREWGWPNALHSFSTRVTTTGTYLMATVRPGDYDVVAISDTLAENWQDPQAIARFAATAVRIHVNDNDHLRQDLTTSSVR